MEKPFTLYTLSGLAKELGTTRNYIRTVIKRLLDAKKPLIYKGYHFVLIGTNGYIAVPVGVGVTVIDG